MTQEEKELLLKDLSERLPYEVKCNVWYGPKSPALYEKDKYTDDILETINPKKGNCTFQNAIGYDFGVFPVEHVKPYLRPMSSMTEEERDEVKEICADYLDEWENAETVVDRWKLDAKTSYLRSVFYNSHHLDWNDLIEKGIALEAPEGMYNII